MCARNDQQTKFWDELCLRLQEGCQIATIIMGDFNSVVDIKLDQYRLTEIPGIPRSLLQFIQDLQLVNIW